MNFFPASVRGSSHVVSAWKTLGSQSPSGEGAPPFGKIVFSEDIRLNYHSRKEKTAIELSSREDTPAATQL